MPLTEVQHKQYQNLIRGLNPESVGLDGLHNVGISSLVLVHYASGAAGD